MTIEHEDDLVGLRRIGAIVAAVRDEVARHVAPGVSTADLDAIGRGALDAHGARSAPVLAYGFPGALCISVNDEIAHGIPSTKKVLRAGDLVNVDVSAELDGYWADCGASYPVGNVSSRAKLLLWATRKAQAEAMHTARAGRSLRDVARAVESRARRHGLGVVKNLGGHGVGRHIHEAPHVANHVGGAERRTLHEGLVLTIEPFLTTGGTWAHEMADGWTLRTADGSIGAQFEHTFVVTNGAPLVLTA
jgi:methionyl aminopeptidase